jgi:hypothetical protein
MLDKGLFRCSADVVFRVLNKLNVDYLLQGNKREMISDVVDNKITAASEKVATLCKTVHVLSSHLIQIWNQLILPAEF